MPLMNGTEEAQQGNFLVSSEKQRKIWCYICTEYPSILTACCVLPNSESFLVVAPGTAVVGTGVMRE